MQCDELQAAGTPIRIPLVLAEQRPGGGGDGCSACEIDLVDLAGEGDEDPLASPATCRGEDRVFQCVEEFLATNEVGLVANCDFLQTLWKLAIG